MKEISRREFLKLSAISAGAAILAACAPAAQPAGGGGAAAPAAGAIKLVQWYHEYGEKGCKEAAQRYADTYNKSQNKVVVDMQWIPGDYAQKLNAALLTDQGPDVFETQPDAGRIKAGQLVDLTDLFPAEVAKDFAPVVMDRNSFKGKVYGIQMIVDTGTLYCRKSILDAAGIKPPKTHAELLDVATKLTTPKQKGLFLGNDGIGGVADLAVDSSGTTKMITDHTKVTWNTEAAAKAVTTIKALNDAKVLLTGAPTDWWDPGSLTSGLAAMQWCGLWAMPGIRSVIQEDFYVTPFPMFGDKGTPQTFLGGWSTYVNAKGKHIPESKTFASWLWIDQKDLQKDWALSYGFHIPPRISVAAAAEPLKTGQAAEVLAATTKYGRGYEPYLTGEMGTYFSDAIAKIVKEGADPLGALNDAAAKAQPALDKVNA